MTFREFSKLNSNKNADLRALADLITKYKSIGEIDVMKCPVCMGECKIVRSI